ncbi:MAG: hypothetical protein HRT88_05710 [Lentisphaeraceae bacterium]|nr:hypothetical protein [Lentisphaeraceae bacterium]
MKRKKKIKIFLAVIVVLYIFSTTVGLNREGGAMEEAMAEVNAKVDKARRKMEKEMNKPFILRIFGSLFGMEGNSFGKLKEDLPKIFKKAIPQNMLSFTKEPEKGELQCQMMRLSDALLYLRGQGIKPDKINFQWKYDDDVVDERYLNSSGMVLEAKRSDADAAEVVLQMPHPFDTEDGLNVEPSKKTDEQKNLSNKECNLDFLTKKKKELQKQDSLSLSEWFKYESSKSLDEARTWIGNSVSVEAQSFF